MIVDIGDFWYRQITGEDNISAHEAEKSENSQSFSTLHILLYQLPISATNVAKTVMSE